MNYRAAELAGRGVSTSSSFGTLFTSPLVLVASAALPTLSVAMLADVGVDVIKWMPVDTFGFSKIVRWGTIPPQGIFSGRSWTNMIWIYAAAGVAAVMIQLLPRRNRTILPGPRPDVTAGALLVVLELGVAPVIQACSPEPAPGRRVNLVLAPEPRVMVRTGLGADGRSCTGVSVADPSVVVGTAPATTVNGTGAVQDGADSARMAHVDLSPGWPRPGAAPTAAGVLPAMIPYGDQVDLCGVGA